MGERFEREEGREEGKGGREEGRGDVRGREDKGGNVRKTKFGNMCDLDVVVVQVQGDCMSGM